VSKSEVIPKLVNDHTLLMTRSTKW